MHCLAVFLPVIEDSGSIDLFEVLFLPKPPRAFQSLEWQYLLTAKKSPPLGNTLHLIWWLRLYHQEYARRPDHFGGSSLAWKVEPQM